MEPKSSMSTLKPLEELLWSISSSEESHSSNLSLKAFSHTVLLNCLDCEHVTLLYAADVKVTLWLEQGRHFVVNNTSWRPLRRKFEGGARVIVLVTQEPKERGLKKFANYSIVYTETSSTPQSSTVNPKVIQYCHGYMMWCFNCCENSCFRLLGYGSVLQCGVHWKTIP